MDKLKAHVSYSHRESLGSFYSCSQCECAYEKLSMLKQHIKSHHEGISDAGTSPGAKEFKCLDCGLAYRSKRDLSYHVRTHTGEKPHQCFECGRSFARPDKLKRHQLVHSGEKPYLCGRCGKGFSRSDKLKTHVRTEHNEETLQCPVCDEKFCQWSDVKKHLRTHAEFVRPNYNEGVPTSKNESNNDAENDNDVANDSDSNDNNDSRNDSSIDSKNVSRNVHDLTNDNVTKNDKKNDKNTGKDKNLMHNDDMTNSATCEVKEEIVNPDYRDTGYSQKGHTASNANIFSWNKSEVVTNIKKKKRKSSSAKKKPPVVNRNVNTWSANDDGVLGRKTPDISESGQNADGQSENPDEVYPVYLFVKQECPEQDMCVEPEECPCMFCGKMFFGQNDLLDHVDKEHLPMTSYISEGDEDNCEPLDDNRQETQQQRRRRGVDESRLTCNICGLVLSTIHSLARHVQSKHTDDRPYVCCHCHKSFVRRDKFGRHLQKHKGMFDYHCTVCGQNFVRWLQWRDHRRSHSYSCNLCEFQTYMYRRLKQHMDRHMGIKNHTCSICGSSYRRRYNLVEHMKSHTGEKPYTCSDCGKRFARLDHMKVHARTHNKDQCLLCVTCGLSFPSTNALSKHTKKHGIEIPRPHICKLCGEEMGKESADRKKHRVMHAKRNEFVCDCCGCWFQSKPLLASHRQSRCTERCNVCVQCIKKKEQSENPDDSVSTTGANDNTLNMSSISKDAEGMLSCNLCAWKFKSKYKLERHTRTHTGEKPFACGLCDVFFSTSYGRSRHMEVVHKTEVAKNVEYTALCSPFEEGGTSTSIQID